MYKVKEELKHYGGIVPTSKLNDLGLSSRQIKKLVEEGKLSRVKHGFYELVEYMPRDEVTIATLFPNAIIFLESAMMHYGYTDRIPATWQIAVDKDANKGQYDIDYPLVQPFYLESKYLNIGIDYYEIDGIKINIYDRERTICDVLRYENKLEKEVFINAIQNYIKDPNINIRNLFEYAKIFNIRNKVQTYIGVWL